MSLGRQGSSSAGRLRAMAFMVVFGLLLTVAGWAQGVCAVCGKAVQGRYLQAAGRVFCSPECFRKTLPVCAVCGAVLEGHHLVYEGRHYCSEACFQRILPTCTICGQPLQESFTIKGRTYCKAHAEGTRCDACRLPVGRGETLPDGRVLCRDCRAAAVLDIRAAAGLYTRAGALVAGVAGRALPPAPTLALVGRDQLPAHSGLDASVSIRELGRYLRDATTTTSRNVFGKVLKEETRVSRRIIILYGLLPDRFLSTAVHERTHDLIAECYPAFDQQAPAWAEEGLCQYTAALVCRRLGYAERVQEIESADDAVYGDGYRWFVRHFGSDGWTEVRRWLDRGGFAGLPRRAPAA